MNHTLPRERQRPRVVHHRPQSSTALAAATCTGEQQLPLKSDIDRWIVETVKRAESLLRSAITLPDGHCWQVDAGRYTFSTGPADTTEAGVPHVIRRADDRQTGDGRDHAHVEIRMFLPEREYATRKGTGWYRKGLGARFTSFITVKSGPHHSKVCTVAVELDDVSPAGDALPGFVCAVAATVNAALHRAVPARMAAAVSTRKMTEREFRDAVRQLNAAIQLHDDGKKDPTKSLTQKIAHNLERNRLQEELRHFRLQYFELVDEA